MAPLAAPADTRPKTPLISFCTLQLRPFCAARFLTTLYDLQSLWELFGSMDFIHAPFIGKDRIATTTTTSISKRQETSWISKRPRL